MKEPKLGINNHYYSAQTQSHSKATSMPNFYNGNKNPTEYTITLNENRTIPKGYNTHLTKHKQSNDDHFLSPHPYGLRINEFYSSNSSKQTDDHLNDITNGQDPISKSINSLISPKTSKSGQNSSGFDASLHEDTLVMKNSLGFDKSQTYIPNVNHKRVKSTTTTSNVIFAPASSEKIFENMNEMFYFFESRFAKIENRLETNESLIHLHDEMTRLKGMEAKSSIQQEENFVNEIYLRLSTLEDRIKMLEDSMTGHKVTIDVKIDEFTKKVEGYLQKFIQNTQFLATKFDTMSSKDSEEENKGYDDMKKRLDEVNQDIKEKLAGVYLSLEEQGKLSTQSLQLVTEEKSNVMRLEDDFIKILSGLKQVNQNRLEFDWLAEEITFLKNKQVQILNYLNYNSNSNLPSLINSNL